jgi:16S rRNA (cytidine1402-2'-O)-methyltransferase
MAGTLFVVATPIGNLEDITLRALRVLREADVIAAEDTRRTARLLAHHAIATPTVSFHEHNTRTRIPQLLARLQAGERVALVTDAGTPGVSDPGVELVAACVGSGIAVDPVPGASAPLTAAAAAGFPLVPFTFLGFPPHGAKDRTGWFDMASSVVGTICFFEAPHRILKTLKEAELYFGSRPIVVARELTKVHQEFLRGTASEVLAGLREPRGEFTILVGPRENTPVLDETEVSDRQLADEFGHATEISGLGRREAVSAIAKRHGRAARDVYAAIERTKNFGE